MRDRWSVRTGFGVVELELRPVGVEAPSEESQRTVRQLMYAFRCRDAEARRVLREVHARLDGVYHAAPWWGGLDADARSADRIGHDILSAVRVGQLVVRRRTTRPAAVPLDDTETDVLGPEAEPTAWIEIELVDQKGAPVPGAAYRIDCDDGRVRTGATNAAGKAREEGLHDGQCKVSFPRLHAPDWKAA
jgi:hypothetical protein